MTETTTTGKRCTGPCGQWKLLEEFHHDPNGRRYRHSHCKECRSEANTDSKKGTKKSYRYVEVTGLSSIREELNLTQRDVAFYLRCPESLIEEVEEGTKLMPYNLAMELVAVVVEMRKGRAA